MLNTPLRALLAFALGATPILSGAVEGISAGIFVGTSPGSPPAVTTGVGTDRLAFGVPCDGVTNCLTYMGGPPTPPNSITFEGVVFDCELNQACVLGVITFFNGTIMPGTQISVAQIKVSIPTNPLIGAYTGSIGVFSTPNTGDPIASRDYLAVNASQFHVDESASYSTPLIGLISDRPFPFAQEGPASAVPLDSQLYLGILGFGAPASPGPGDVLNPIPVPEMPTWALLIIGFAALGRALRTQRLSAFA